jgi:plastocyanin
MKTTEQQGVLPRVPLSYMGWITVGSLVGIAIGFWVLQITIGVTVLPIVILAVVSIIMAALVSTGVRWMPAMAALYGVGMWIGGPTSQPYSLYHLTHPQEGGPFIASVLVYVLAIVTIVAGIVATMENYRGGERRAPRWTNSFLGVMAGFILGAAVVSLLVLTGNTSSAQSNQSTEPGTAHMGIASFTQQTVTLTKGSTLKLVDDGNFTHIIANGSWDGSNSKPAREPGAPSVQNVQVNGGSISIGPFNTAGTFSIYCTIHPGMMLKVIVQ